MYKVLSDFVDLQDDLYRYKKGDTFPRSGAKASKERIGELAGSDNKAGIPLIAETVQKKTTKKKG